MRTIAALTLTALLAGCASSGRIDPGYAGYLQAEDRREARQAERIAAIADGSSCNGDANCVMQRAAYAAIVEAAALGGAASQGIAPPPRKLEWSEHIRNISPLTGQVLGSFDNYSANRFNRDNIRSNNELQLGIMDRLTGGWERTNAAAFNAFANQPATTHVNGDLISGTQTNIGGDQISGTQTVVGRDQIGGDQFQGDWRTGDNTQRDTIGRDRTDYGTGNRLNSPGPYRDTGNTGDRCSGIGCQTVNPPPSDDEDD